MKKILITLSLVLILLVTGVAGTVAQQGSSYPTIISFESSVAAISVAEAELGTTNMTLTWRIVGMGTEDRVLLQMYQLNNWIPLPQTDALPAAGTYEATITHPLNFGPPTYRLSVIDANGETRDERVLTILWTQPAGPPLINTFVAAVQALDINAAATGAGRVSVTWSVANRGPLTNLMFEQVLGDGQAIPVELPRTALWVPSAGVGEVAPVVPLEGNAVVLRLRVVDMETGSALAERVLDPIELTGVMTLQPTPAPTALPPAASTARIVSFTVTPQNAIRGDVVTLNWEVANAAQVGVWLLGPDGRLSRPGPATIPRGSWTVALADAYTDVARFMLFASDASGAQTQSTVTVYITCPFTYFFTSPATDPSCPADESHTVQALFQSFERGNMLWRADTGDILVLYRNGTVARYRDTWMGEFVTYATAAPTNLFLPQGSFGRAWVDNAPIRDGLGWATTLERGYTMTYQRGGRGRTYLTWPDGTVIWVAGNDTWGYN